ncbi:MAG: hypothetical protein AB1894_15755 [Chloroflexota bacterium]
MQRVFTLTYHLHGTLAADATIRWIAPFDCTLIHVAAVASNDSDATLKVGSSVDDDGYLTAAVIGDSGTPVEKGRSDFIGALCSESGQYPHIADGTIVLLTLDHDGAGGTAAQNVSIQLTFTEG